MTSPGLDTGARSLMGQKRHRSPSTLLKVKIITKNRNFSLGNQLSDASHEHKRKKGCHNEVILNGKSLGLIEEVRQELLEAQTVDIHEIYLGVKTCNIFLCFLSLPWGLILV